MAYIQCEHCGHKIEVEDFKVVLLCPACKCAVDGDLLAKGRFAFSLPTAIAVGLAIGLTIFFSVAAAIVRPAAKMGAVPECIVLHVLFGAGYGWLLPLLIGR